MFRTRLLVLALVVLAASCGGSTRSMDGGAPPEAPRVDGGTPTYDAGGEGMVLTAEVWTEPADLSTGVRNGGLRIGARSLSYPIPRKHLEALASRVRLVTWPEVAQVDSEVTIVEGATSYIEVVPRTPLGDRWYALATSLPPFPGDLLVPPRFQWAGEFGVELATGERAARFSVASEPFIAILALCQTPNRELVRVRFSEPVLLPEGLELSVVQGSGGGAVMCPSYESGDGYLLSSCTGLDMVSAMRVSLHGRIETALGVALTDGAGALGGTSTTLAQPPAIDVPPAPQGLRNYCRDYRPVDGY